MRRATLVALGLMWVLSLAACGGGATPQAAATPVAATPAAATAPAAQATGCLGSAEGAIVDLNCREVTIAVENAYLPFNYILVKTGQPGGWDYEAWTDICTRLHCKPVFVETAWDALIQSVSQGQYDVGADGITITEDRKKIADFSLGYIKIQQRLLVRKGEQRFNSIESFAAVSDLSMGTQANTTNYETAKKYLPENRLKAFEQFPFAVQALIGGDVDAVIIDEVVGMGYMGENAEKLELVGPSISSDELGFVYAKGSKLVDPVNQALQAMMKDGTLEKLNKKYFGPDFKITNSDISTGN